MPTRLKRVLSRRRRYRNPCRWVCTAVSAGDESRHFRSYPNLCWAMLIESPANADEQHRAVQANGSVLLEPIPELIADPWAGPAFYCPLPPILASISAIGVRRIISVLRLHFRQLGNLRSGTTTFRTGSPMKNARIAVFDNRNSEPQFVEGASHCIWVEKGEARLVESEGPTPCPSSNAASNSIVWSTFLVA